MFNKVIRLLVRSPQRIPNLIWLRELQKNYKDYKRITKTANVKMKITKYEIESY
jgi:hypothetical protein